MNKRWPKMLARTFYHRIQQPILTGVSVCLWFFVIALTMGAGQVLTPNDRANALNELDASQKEFLDSVAGLRDEQWNFRPSPEAWSIAERAELIVNSEDELFEVIRKLARSPFVPTKGARQQDELFLKMVRDQRQTVPSPQATPPAHRWPNQAALLKHFKEQRRQFMEFLQHTKVDLRLRFQVHPLYGTLDAYQWILLLSEQTRRDTGQLNELKRNPVYPK
jgi:hypothetical protein